MLAVEAADDYVVQFLAFALCILTKAGKNGCSAVPVVEAKGRILGLSAFEFLVVESTIIWENLLVSTAANGWLREVVAVEELLKADARSSETVRVDVCVLNE